MFYQNLKRFGVHVGLGALGIALAYLGNHLGELGVPVQYISLAGIIIGAAASFVRTQQGVGDMADAVTKEITK